MDLRTNSDFSPRTAQLTGFYKRDGVCLLRGTDWIFKSDRYTFVIKGFFQVKKITQYQEGWLQHVQRMDTNRIPKQALQYKPKGRRNRGRPRKRWRDQLHFEDQGTGNTPNPL